ncbi:SRPBCC domain-containing protein [Paenibacillus dendritiformis]|uniref:SRPBCC family protein n=1 Tax=Paenibacillus dendritiformis TaxID=130049 RepID=UPI00105A3735|nr:SRPBCC domain-containing protein [Paenibacillus dendritiformis]TDL49277.1 SRPBCC domain-containing protein [Paenibacillus dendritiformis]
MTITEEIWIEAEPELVWNAWTQSDRITLWFAPAADIEPMAGGKFELYFNPASKDSMNTIGCKIVRYDEPRSFTFQWKGPDPFADTMNRQEQLTLVKVTLDPADQGTAVRLEHSGWMDTEAWKQARQWHVEAWRQMLASLKAMLESGEGAGCCP